MPSPHLWLALSPHGYGHAAMTAPVIAALRRHLPDLRLTVQTSLPAEFLRGRYGTAAALVEGIPDFGLRMNSSTRVDRDASAEAYLALAARWDELVAAEAERLAAAAPDLVLANVPPLTLAAAACAGIPAVALSSLNWADMVRVYLGDRPALAPVLDRLVAAYDSAGAFLRVTPAMAMPSLGRVRDIGPVILEGTARPEVLAAALGLVPGERVGLIAFGGIAADLDLVRWPVLPGWRWLTTLEVPPGRADLLDWRVGGLGFSDLLASVAVVVTKPGYGTFTEAGLAGVPVLYQPRPDWPECPALDDWLAAHTRALAVDLTDPAPLAGWLDLLQAQPARPPAVASGNDEAAVWLAARLGAGRD
ncbi:MAG: hypothetical protein RLZZ501_1623 [Pseudomonadota bacterium]|jgi:hypothetical protein